MHCTVLIHFDAMDTEYWIGFSINFCSKTICSAFKWHLCAEAKPHNKNNLSIRCYAEIGNKCGFFLCCSRRFRIYSIDKISPSALRLCNTHKTYLVGNEFVFRMFIVQLWKQCVLRERFEVLKWYVPWHHGTVFSVHRRFHSIWTWIYRHSINCKYQIIFNRLHIIIWNFMQNNFASTTPSLLHHRSVFNIRCLRNANIKVMLLYFIITHHSSPSTCRFKWLSFMTATLLSIDDHNLVCVCVWINVAQYFYVIHIFNHQQANGLDSIGNKINILCHFLHYDYKLWGCLNHFDESIKLNSFHLNF